MGLRAVALALVVAVVPAHAQPPGAIDAEDPAPPSVVVTEPPRYFPEPSQRLRRSFPLATAEVLGINAMFSLVALAIGKPYARISLDSIKQNLTSEWVWDEDAFSTNQFGHPYLGSLMYSAARANGFGMGGASAFSFAGSAFWELFMETETPSINDQIFTPFGGILFGEVIHRFGRAILWQGDPRPRIGRVIVSTVVDPVGMFTRSALGEAWSHPQPPPMFGYVSFGWNTLTSDFGDMKGTTIERYPARFNARLALSYGLPIDASFKPRRPMDHFEFVAEGDVSADDAFLAIHTRGLLWGRAFELWGMHGVGGLFGGYDFENPRRIRVGAASLGLGATVHLPLGERNFFQGSVVASLIPFGAAGGDVDEDRTGDTTDRDYHRGWGSTQLVSGRLGRRGLGMLYVNSRNFEIDGTYFDEGSEVVSSTRAGGMVALIGRHGLGVEGVYSVRRGDFEGNARDVLDSSIQLRVSYVLMQDLTFGGGAAP